MKNKTEVLSFKHRQSALPLFQTVTVILAFDRWGSPQWFQGIVYFLLFLIWCSNIWHILNDRVVYLRNGKLTYTDSEVSA